MSVLNENQLLGASGAGGDYEIEQSLRFNDDDNAYLSRTPSSAGNRRTFTYSVWIKRGNLGTQQRFFSAASASNNEFHINFYQDKIHMWNYVGSTPYPEFKTTQLFRDPSSWYHIVASVDSTNSTANDRMRLYVNGVRITAFDTSNNPDLNYQFLVNENNIQHTIGTRPVAYTQPMDGYMGEINFIDGQALTPDSFGETGDYGEWKAKSYAGTYGTNGFYLPFKQDYTVEGFSTVVYEATQANQYIGGTGFQPDFIWFKNRTRSSPHRLVDAVRGLPNMLMTNTTGVEATAAADGTMVRTVTGFAPDGFTLGVDDGGYRVNSSTGDDIVAWSWDMGGTTASNTNGSITSSVRANTTYGQSIVSYSGTGSAATIGHGLASAPTMIIVKNRSATNPWWVYNATLGAGKQLRLNDTNAEGSDGGVIWNNTAPTSSVFSVNSNTGSNGSGNSLIAYCFHDVANYSKFGSYSGNGSTTGPVVTLGFSPAFVMIKRTDAAGNSWRMFDNTRNPTNPVDKIIYANLSNAETTQDNLEFVSDGLNIIGTSTDVNASGGTYIYAAFADTREYAYWYDQSGNNNDWTSEGGLTESDVMLDSPTNNFATFNPLSGSTGLTLSEGNTELTSSGSSTPWRHKASSFMVSEGKWYYESVFKNSASSMVGITNADSSTAVLDNDVDENVSYRNNGASYNEGTINSGFGATYTAGDIIGIAFDCDSQTVTFYKNNVSQGTESYSIPNIATLTTTSDTGSFVANFGADSSFAGNKTPQGNQDSNGIGDFYYAPPTGFLALCTANLPDVDVIPSEHFNTVLYTGTGSSNAISNLGLTPDFTWIKSRSNTEGHGLVDSVRGATKLLSSNTTDSEATSANYVASLDSDGFTVGTSTLTNGNGYTYVAWNWKAGGTAVSNTNGSITSSVSANPSAGFSIVSYTGVNNSSYGSGTTAVIGHGLSETPDLIIVKSRDNVNDNWVVHHKDSAINTTIFLDKTDALATGRSEFTAVSSSTFSVLGPNFVNRLGENYISYCFHSVESYSKVGSYVGNGNDDGTFIYCGFRPAYVMVKRTDASGNWDVIDTVRNEYNDPDKNLQANTSVAEFTNTRYDILSNGIKMRRGSSGDTNASGGTYIFIAFAESPFKHTNAR